MGSRGKRSRFLEKYGRSEPCPQRLIPPLPWGQALSGWLEEGIRMAEVKGKIIIAATDLLRCRPGVRSAAIAAMIRMAGKTPQELEPEGWYDTKVLDVFLRAIEDCESPLVAWAGIMAIGQNLYSSIIAESALPQDLMTPLDLFTYEGWLFLANHRGIEVSPRRFIKTEARLIVLEALSPGYHCALTEGIFHGLLRACRVTHGRVKQTLCIRNGYSRCQYEIQWQDRVE
jgi:hypothetical protein